jgi:hypothetical protein
MTAKIADRILSPLPRFMFIAFLLVSQLIKIIIIASQPNSPGFIHWFYGFHNYPPYSFQNTIEDNLRNLHGIPFPVPYSMLWYAFYEITQFGYWAYNLTTFAIDCALLWVVARNHSQFYTAYILQLSFYFLLVSPQDFILFTFIVIGRIRVEFLSLAIAFKLPLIPPILDPKIWSFIISNPYAVHDPLNWARYLIIGVAWSVSLILALSDRGRLAFLYRHFHVNISDISRSRIENVPCQQEGNLAEVPVSSASCLGSSSDYP